MPIPLDLDATVPVLVFKTSRNVIQHSTLGIIRSLGRLGVPVYACVEDRFAPAAMSRYLTRAFVWDTGGLNTEQLLTGMAAIGERLGRPTVLVPIDDSAAAFVAEHSDVLAKWFLFPRLPRELPRRLANKRDLYLLCRSIGVPCPETAFPDSVDEVHAFIERVKFPAVVKAAEPQRLPKGTRSVSIAQTPQELLAIYRQAQSPESPNLIFQEYIPESLAEDWIFHGYCNPQTDCLVTFTGKKLRSHPAFAGPTTLGVSVLNEPLSRQTETLLKAVAYAGIVDIDYRLDKRDGQYKLLDFNPRIGANFRMFEDRAGVDVVRALHLDLTRRTVRRLPVVEGRTFIVEPYDLFTSLSYMRRGGLTVRGWWRSLKGKREIAWFSRNDPVPFLTMCVRLLIRAVGCSVQRSWAQICASHRRRPKVVASKPRTATQTPPTLDIASEPALSERNNYMSHNDIGNSMQIERSGQASYVPAVASYTIPQSVSPSADSLGLNELTTSLWRRRTTLAGAAIGGLLIGLVISHLTTPIYRARASVQIEGFSNDQFVREVSPISILPNATPENYLQNEVKLLESETLAKRVAERLGDSAENHQGGAARVLAYLRNNISFLRPPRMTPEQRRIKNVQKALSVRTSLQSQVIELFYDAPDPHVATRGANSAVSELISLNREAGWQLAKDTTDWLNQQVADLKATLENSNLELQDFARSAGLVFAGKQGTLAEDRMKQLQDALAKAEADRAEKQSRYEAALASSGDVMSDSVAAGPLRQYETDLQNLRRELAQLQTIYTPTNYRVEKVKAQIAETEKSIRNERKEIVSRLRTEYQAATGRERLLSAVHALQLKTVEQQMDQERRYDVKKGEIDATQRLYESMLQKLKEAGAASALRTTNVRLIDSASVPPVPYSPNSPLNMAIGFAMGALGGIGFVLVREGSSKVRRPGESNLPDVPELGVIPSARDAWALEDPGRKLIGLKHGLGELAVVTRNRDTSLLAESFRAALTSILFGAAFNRGSGAKEPGGRVLVVTSIDVLEGKTTILTNLGIAAAEGNQRVLLIDADLRRPRVHALVNLPNRWGLADMLQGRDQPPITDETPLKALTRRTGIPNLWVLPAGSIDAAMVSSLLYSSDLPILLQRFRREFDLILIDTPPMMLYADARVLGRMSDGVVLVVRANTKSREELKAAHLKLVQDQIPVVGTILNDWKMDPSQTRAYGRYYNHYRQMSA
jgi:capsular exopolysaccharide synthesis family protein